jgi:hypothetical protein
LAVQTAIRAKMLCDKKDDAHGAFTPQGACFVRVQGLWCHVLSVCMWALLVYRGMDSLEKEE